MKRTLTQREKLFVFAGGGLLGLYFIVAFIFQPVYDKQKGMDRQIQNKIQFIQKYFEVLNRKSYYDAKDKSNKETQSILVRRLLNETKPGLASANLQKILENFARQSGVKIERVRVEKPSEIEDVTAIPIDLTVRSTMKNLAQLIYKIENYEKLLVVEELTSRRVNKTDPEDLQTHLLVNAFIKNFELTESKKT